MDTYYKNLSKVFPEEIIIGYIFKGNQAKIDAYFLNDEYLRSLEAIKTKRKLVKEVENYLTNKKKCGKLIEWLFKDIDIDIIKEAIKSTKL